MQFLLHCNSSGNFQLIERARHDVEYHFCCLSQSHSNTLTESFVCAATDSQDQGGPGSGAEAVKVSVLYSLAPCVDDEEVTVQRLEM